MPSVTSSPALGPAANGNGYPSGGGGFLLPADALPVATSSPTSSGLSSSFKYAPMSMQMQTVPMPVQQKVMAAPVRQIMMASAPVPTSQPQFRTEYQTVERRVPKTVVENQTVQRSRQMTRQVPKLTYDRRTIQVPKQVTYPVTTMVPRMVQVLVPETTMKTEWIYEDKFVSIPRQLIEKKIGTRKVPQTITVEEAYEYEELAMTEEVYEVPVVTTVQKEAVVEETYTETEEVEVPQQPYAVRVQAAPVQQPQQMRAVVRAAPTTTMLQAVPTTMLQAVPTTMLRSAPVERRVMQAAPMQTRMVMQSSPPSIIQGANGSPVRSPGSAALAVGSVNLYSTNPGN
jgi:hypothetical protein